MALKKGFSLIELIVVISLLSLLMLAISGTMLMTVISSNRVRTTTKVKQAGNYALGQIQSMIRNSKSIVSCNSSGESITIVNQNGAQTTINLESARIASNSGTYLTPANTTTSVFNLTCEPSDIAPNLVKITFDLKDNLSSDVVDSPTLHFETSVNIRNE